MDMHRTKLSAVSLCPHIWLPCLDMVCCPRARSGRGLFAPRAAESGGGGGHAKKGSRTKRATGSSKRILVHAMIHSKQILTQLLHRRDDVTDAAVLSEVLFPVVWLKCGRLLRLRSGRMPCSCIYKRFFTQALYIYI